MDNAITYVPLQQNTDCLVYKLYLQHQGARFRSSGQYVVTSNTPTLQGVIKVNKLRSISFVANCDADYPVLITTDKNYLTENWIDRPVELGIFFISNGASMFRNHHKWAKKFRSWLSFGETFQANIDIADFMPLQKKLYDEIFIKISECDNSNTLKHELEKLYTKYMDLICEECNKSDRNVSDLLAAMQCIRGNKYSVTHG